jgi:hypothetical protein
MAWEVTKVLALKVDGCLKGFCGLSMEATEGQKSGSESKQGTGPPQHPERRFQKKRNQQLTKEKQNGN